MYQKFLKNLFILLALNLLIKPFWLLGIDRGVQNTVGASEYGFYFALLNFSFLFNILLDFGITNYNNRTIAQNNNLIGKLFPGIFVLKLLLFVVYLIFTLVGAFVIDYTSQQISLLLLLAVNQLFMSMVLYLRSNLSGMQLFRTDGFISVLDRLLMIILVGVLLWGQVVEEFKISYFVYAQTVSHVITFLITLAIVKTKSGVKLRKIQFNVPLMLVVLRQSFPFAVLILIMTITSRADGVMIERILPDGARYSGIYASAFRLLDASVQFAFLFAVLLLPMFSRMLSLKQQVGALTKIAFTLLIAPTITLVIGSGIYSHEIMALLYPTYPGETASQFSARLMLSGPTFALLMIGLIGSASSYVFGTLLTANGNLRQLNIIALAGLIVNLSLNFLLIPVMKTEGAAIASLATQWLVAGIQLVVVYRIFRFRIEPGYLYKLIIFVAGVGVIGFLSTMLPWQWYINIVLMALTSLSFGAAIRLFQIRKMIQMVVSDEGGQT